MTAQRFRRWYVGQVGLAIVLIVAGASIALHLTGSEGASTRGTLMLFAFLASLSVALASGFVWLRFQRGYAQPIGALARDVRTLLQARRIDRALRVPKGHQLDDLPEAVAQLTDTLRGSRRQIARAMATATSRVEEEKGWLEMILLELVREGVIVCNAEHCILLYNRPAARLFRTSHTLGLGRSLLELVAAEPVRHALERLEDRLRGGSGDLTVRFVCGTHEADRLLLARMALIVDHAGKRSGYVLTLEDISAELVELQRGDAVRRAVTEELRGPVASLRAAAENLTSFPDMDVAQRRMFEGIIFHESSALSDRIEALATQYEAQTVGSWPMMEIHSPDLFKCVARHVHDELNISLRIVGKAQWLVGDSHLLMVTLEYLLERLQSQIGVCELEAAAGADRSHAFIELRWSGSVVPVAVLDEWLAAPLPSLSGTTCARVLEQHASEPWSHAGPGVGSAALRIPLQLTADPQARDEDVMPPRPEFYDFELMNTQRLAGDLLDRRLKDLTYVVFDTETTGLRPTGGDEIISIAAVRVTQGRPLRGETFDQLVNPARNIPTDSIRFHGITDDDVRDKPSIEDVLPRFHRFAGDAILVAHNAAFDMKFIKLKEAQCNVQFRNPVIDTLLLSVLIEGSDEDHSLDGICERLDITIEDRHSALGDALATADVLVHFLDRLEVQGHQTLGQVMRASNMENALRFRAAQFGEHQLAG